MTNCRVGKIRISLQSDIVRLWMTYCRISLSSFGDTDENILLELNGLRNLLCSFRYQISINFSSYRNFSHWQENVTIWFCFYKTKNSSTCSKVQQLDTPELVKFKLQLNNLFLEIPLLSSSIHTLFSQILLSNFRMSITFLVSSHVP